MKDGLIYHMEEIYSHEQEKEYVRLYFDLPKDVQSIEVKLYVNNDKDVIDFGLEDGKGLRGWSGGARRHLIIKEDWAMDGYGSGDFYPSTWAVLLGLYKIKEKCMVQVEVSIHFREDRWYKGDLHIHSTHSDGVFLLSQVIENAKETALDFIALTDHNTFSQNNAYVNQENLVIIEGVELTTYGGHVNFLGHPKPISHFVCKNSEDMHKYIKEGRQKGAMISVNHPFHGASWDYGLEDYDFRSIEVWNGQWSEENQKAINWWHEQLCQGKRITAVGGSDTHEKGVERWYGTPTTWIKTDTFSSKGMLESIRRGQVCVTASPESARVNLILDDVQMGGCYQVTDGEIEAELICEYWNGQGEVLRLYSENGLIDEITLVSQEGRIVFQVQLDRKFYRVEVVGEKGIVTISNAVYVLHY